jgi:hypothetical protein
MVSVLESSEAKLGHKFTPRNWWYLIGRYMVNLNFRNFFVLIIFFCTLNNHKMLKISTKRGREWNPDLSPVKCSPMAMDVTNTTPTKKVKPFETSTSFEPSTINVVRPDSPFSIPAVIPQNNDPEELALYLKKNKQRNLNQSQNNTELNERLFTVQEVKEIVARAIQEKEQSLRMEYDRILQERLQEQFRNFSKFNEDYISRQLKHSDFSYLS